MKRWGSTVCLISLCAMILVFSNIGTVNAECHTFTGDPNPVGPKTRESHVLVGTWKVICIGGSASPLPIEFPRGCLWIYWYQNTYSQKTKVWVETVCCCEVTNECETTIEVKDGPPAYSVDIETEFTWLFGDENPPPIH